jgi:hypothetical protein
MLCSVSAFCVFVVLLCGSPAAAAVVSIEAALPGLPLAFFNALRLQNNCALLFWAVVNVMSRPQYSTCLAGVGLEAQLTNQAD